MLITGIWWKQAGGNGSLEAFASSPLGGEENGIVSKKGGGKLKLFSFFLGKLLGCIAASASSSFPFRGYGYCQGERSKKGRGKMQREGRRRNLRAFGGKARQVGRKGDNVRPCKLSAISSRRRRQNQSVQRRGDAGCCRCETKTETGKPVWGMGKP